MYRFVVVALSCGWVFWGAAAVLLAQTPSPPAPVPLSASRDQGAFRVLGDRLSVHDDTIARVSWSADGRRLVSAGADGVAVVWNTSNGKETRRLRAEAPLVAAFFVDRAGDEVVTLDWSGMACFWSGSKAQPSARVALRGEEHSEDESFSGLAMLRIDIASDRKELAAIHRIQGRVVLRLDLVDRRPLPPVPAPDGTMVISIRYAPSSSRVLLVGRRTARPYTSVLTLVDLETGDTVFHETTAGAGMVFSIIAAAKEVVFPSADAWRFHSLDDGRLLREIPGHGITLARIDAFAGSRRAVATEGDLWMRIVDLESGKSLHERIAHAGGVEAVALSPDGNAAASGGRDGAVRFWDMASAARRFDDDMASGSPTALCFSADGETLFSRCSRGGWTEWDVRRGASKRKRPPVADDPGRAHVCQDGRDIGVTRDGVISIRSSSGKKEIRLDLDGDLSHRSVTVVDPAGKHLLAIDGERAPLLVDLGSGARRALSLPFDLDSATVAAISPDGTRVAVANERCQMVTWSTADGSVVASRSAATGDALSSLGFIDNETFLGSHESGALRRWPVGDGATRVLARFKRFFTAWEMIASADGNAVVAGEPAFFRVLSPTTGRDLLWIDACRGVQEVTAFAIDARGRQLATGLRDGTILLWDLVAGERRRGQ